ncbi:Hypp6845 [Branchiostoma lanceolatum]|uniref:Hypp6845 protein n=1 Tax=Branchiostoma lanceolatum TaxID=7740 RepID=A0A8K0EAQ0_BRALA|nr:Hypp6845 [Branchiostoma lanceolatum]
MSQEPNRPMSQEPNRPRSQEPNRPMSQEPNINFYVPFFITITANLEAALQAEEPTRPEPAQQDDQNDTEAYIDTLEIILETIPQPQQPGSQLQQHYQQQPTPVTHYRRIAPKPTPAPPVPISHISPYPTFVFTMPNLCPQGHFTTRNHIPWPHSTPTIGPIFSPITNQGGVIMGPFGGIHAFHPYNLGINPTIPMASRPIGVACAPQFGRGVLRWSRETVIAVTSNIESMEFRRKGNAAIGYEKTPGLVL